MAIVLCINFHGHSKTGFCLACICELPFGTTAKTKSRFNGTIHWIRTAELTMLRNQTTVNNIVVTFSPFSPISPFSPRGPGKPYKKKGTKIGWLLLTCRLSFQILLENVQKGDFTTCVVCTCDVCIPMHAWEHVKQVMVFGSHLASDGKKLYHSKWQ